ncbi:MAG: FAD-dependent oxidoreductase, partial [Pseudonocardiaceae bacterium]
VEDCERITELAGRGPMAVIGGGLLGVEAARGLAGLGVDVTVVHPVGHLMERQLDAGRGSVLAGVLDGLGVRLRLGVAAASWRPGHEGLGVLTLTDGSTLDVAGVVVSAGVAPQTWLARRAGVTVGRSILVAQLPARAVICRCNGVTKGDLVTAWSTGARERAALATATRATTGCGSCADAGEGLCTWLNDADPESAVPAGQEGAA